MTHRWHHKVIADTRWLIVDIWRTCTCKHRGTHTGYVTVSDGTDIVAVTIRCDRCGHRVTAKRRTR